MKKLILFVLLLGTLSASAQKYVSAGVGHSAGAWGWGVEAGVYNEKRWISISFDQTPEMKESFIGVKYYYKLFNVGLMDMYAHGALKFQTKEVYIMPELGSAFVFNVSKRFAPQLTLVAQASQGYVYFSKSVGINYWIFKK